MQLKIVAFYPLSFDSSNIAGYTSIMTTVCINKDIDVEDIVKDSPEYQKVLNELTNLLKNKESKLSLRANASWLPEGIDGNKYYSIWTKTGPSIKLNIGSFVLIIEEVELVSQFLSRIGISEDTIMKENYEDGGAYTYVRKKDLNESLSNKNSKVKEFLCKKISTTS